MRGLQQWIGIRLHNTCTTFPTRNLHLIWRCILWWVQPHTCCNFLWVRIWTLMLTILPQWLCSRCAFRALLNVIRQFCKGFHGHLDLYYHVMISWALSVFIFLVFHLIYVGNWVHMAHDKLAHAMFGSSIQKWKCLPHLAVDRCVKWQCSCSKHQYFVCLVPHSIYQQIMLTLSFSRQGGILNYGNFFKI